MQECQICCEDKDMIALLCCCKLCEECLVRTIDAQYIDVVDQFKCPGQCDSVHQMEDFQDSEMLCSVLTKKYLKNSRDIRGCPRSQCEYFGMITNGCSQYICNCDYEWKEKGHQISITSMVNSFYTTRQCPKCEREIYKNGGCNHMTCKCKYEFCWICAQEYQSHSKKMCAINMIVKGMLYLYMLLTIIVQLSFQNVVIYVLQMAIKLLLLNGCLMFLILGLIEIAGIIKITYQIRTYYKYGNTTFNRINSQKTVMSGMLLTQSLILGSIFYYFYGEEQQLYIISRFLDYLLNELAIVIVILATMRLRQ